MPGAPRPSGKAKKIAYKILGEPQNLKAKESPEKVQDQKQIDRENAMRIR